MVMLVIKLDLLFYLFLVLTKPSHSNVVDENEANKPPSKMSFMNIHENITNPI